MAWRALLELEDPVRGFPDGTSGKEPTYLFRKQKRDTGSIPGSQRSPGEEHDNHSSFLAWRIPWTEEPGGLQSMRLQSQTELKLLSMQACQRSRGWNPRQVLRECHGPSWDNLSKLVIMRGRCKRKLKDGVFIRISREIEPIGCACARARVCVCIRVCVCVCVCVCVYHQAPRSMEFPTPGDLPELGIETKSLVSPALAGGFFTTEPLQKPIYVYKDIYKRKFILGIRS